MSASASGLVHTYHRDVLGVTRGRQEEDDEIRELLKSLHRTSRVLLEGGATVGSYPIWLSLLKWSITSQAT
jgi:hypothetical protein